MKYFFILLLYGLSAFAQTDQLARDCRAAAMRFGDGKGDDYISKDCFDWVKTELTPERSFFVKDKIQIMGSGNLIFISEFKVDRYLTHIIAGVYSELKNLKALTASLEHRELYVVQDREVFVYSLDITGNVGPLRSMKIKGLSTVKSISFNEKSQELILSDGKLELTLARLTKAP